MAGMAFGGLIFCVNGYYAYSFFIGSYMITEGVENKTYNRPYSAGDIMSCFIGVIYGMVHFGLAAPIVKALSEGRVAGKLAYDIIMRKSRIDIDENKGEKVEKLEGEIELKNVSFTYPTRKEVKVLDNISIKFEKGKTTALVGTSGSGKSTIIQLIERFYDPD